MTKKSKGNPIICDICGETRLEFVALLVNPDPVEHEFWCNDCYEKTIRKEQAKNGM